MPAAPVLHRPQTLKQARAAYRASTNGAVSEAERKRLDRLVELDRRAWRAKETEKRRAEALKKKAEKDDKERSNVHLATQRKCDKFGYRSSQMHLGAFFGRPGVATNGARTAGDGFESFVEDEEFGDEDLGDHVLLDALDTEGSKLLAHAPTSASDGRPSSGIPRKAPEQARHKPAVSSDDLLEFHDFGSSTQVARELDIEMPGKREATDRPIRTTSSCSNGEFGSFDLTDDDLEELDESVDLRPTGPQLKTVTEDRTLMPPPPLPPPPIAKVLPVRLQSGFTVAELEYFIDDDIQLTQVG